MACPLAEELCEIPTRLKSSTIKLGQIKEGVDELNNRIAIVSAEIDKTSFLAQQTKAEGRQAANELDELVKVAVRSPNPATIGAALDQLARVEELQDTIAKLKERDRIYQGMLQALSSQIEEVQGRSDALLAQLPPLETSLTF